MEVLTVSWDAGRALHEVRCLDHLVGGSNVSFTARYVFLCAGSVNTTELLLRSQGDQKRRGLEKLGQKYFVNADSLATVVHAGAETFASEGPVITSALVFQKEKIGDGDREAKLQRPHKSSPRTWFLIEDGGYPREAAKLFSLFQSPALLGRNHFDPDPAPPKILSTVKELFDRPRPDRYPAFLDGFVAALVAGTLPDVLAQDFKDATTSLKKLAGGLRDAEIGDLTSEIRDAVVFNSVLFRFLERLKVYKLRRLWMAIYRFSVWFMKIDDAQLLSTTLEATHHRYGVDKPRGLPSRISRLLLGEPYPVNESRSHFDPKPPPRPQERAQALLLAMGRDDMPAHLKLDGDRLIAWFPEGGFPTLDYEERVMRGVADQLGGTLRSNPLWALARRPVTSHSHGGCALGEVTNEWGKVNGYEKLYINDGSLLPTSVGVNPSSTIAAIAERNVERFVRHVWYVEHGRSPDGRLPCAWQADIDAAKAWNAEQLGLGVDLEPPVNRQAITLHHKAIGFSFTEAMSGHMAPVGGDLDNSRLPPPGTTRVPLAPFLVAERAGRGDENTPPLGQVSFTLAASVTDLGTFLDDPSHTIAIPGTINIAAALLGASGADVEVPVTDGTLNLLVADVPGRRLMLYHLPFTYAGHAWTLVGHKEIQDDPGFDAWLDAATLYTELWRDGVKVEDFVGARGDQRPQRARARGILRLGIRDFLDNQVTGLHAVGTKEPARTIWTLGSFAVFFFGSMQGTYAPEIDRFLSLFGKAPWRPRGQPPAQEAHTIAVLKGL